MERSNKIGSPTTRTATRGASPRNPPPRSETQCYHRRGLSSNAVRGFVGIGIFGILSARVCDWQARVRIRLGGISGYELLRQTETDDFRPVNPNFQPRHSREGGNPDRRPTPLDPTASAMRQRALVPTTSPHNHGYAQDDSRDSHAHENHRHDWGNRVNHRYPPSLSNRVSNRARRRFANAPIHARSAMMSPSVGCAYWRLFAPPKSP